MAELDIHTFLQAASKLFRASLEVNSTDSSTFMLAGLLERRRKDWDAARELFRKGVAITKENASLFQVRPDIRYLLHLSGAAGPLDVTRLKDMR